MSETHEPPDAWQRISQLFDELFELATEVRNERLAEIAHEDPDVARELASLLAHSQEGPIERAVQAGIELAKSAVSEPLPERIGPYRVLGEIGRGGLATVVLAEREEPFRQEVAIKLLSDGFSSPEVVRRLRQERQILARLEHPAIARLIDGGALPDGRPYVVMERIVGAPIDVYASEAKLDLGARLELFVRVAAAVEYAHRNLIVHRDLKPSNLLVTRDGQPKLLDFGIAKLLLDGPADRTSVIATSAEVRLLTPAYASPEQVLGLPASTATDVYALGVLLYRLVTGRHPYSLEGGVRAVERRVLEDEPELASRALRRAADFDDPLWRGDLALRRLGKALAGDIDGILARALAKRTEDRYPSVEQLADDLRRHLDGLPVRARHATFGYRAGRFARRHRTALAATALAALGLIAGTIAALWQASRAEAARLRAEEALAVSEREQQRTERVTGFLIDLFEAPDPARARGAEISAVELLHRGAETARQSLATEPAVQASLLDAMGQVYGKLGLFDQAEPLLEQALRLESRALGPDHPDTAASRARLGNVWIQRGHYEKAERALRSALAVQERETEGPKTSAATAKTLSDLGMALYHQQRFDEAERALTRSLALRRGSLGAEHPQTVETLNNLAAVWLARGDFERAERAMREAIALHRKALGDDHPSVATNLNNLGALLAQRGQLDEALTITTEALAIRRKVFAEDHPQIAETLTNLGWIRLERGDLAGARGAFREALDGTVRELGAEHPNVARIHANLGDVEREAGDVRAAEQEFRAALVIRRRVHPAGDPRLAYPLLRLGEIALERRDAASAEPLLAEAAKIQAASFPAASWQVAEAESLFGRCLVVVGKKQTGGELLNKSLPTLQQTLGADHRLTRATAAALSSLSAHNLSAAGDTPRSPR